MNITDKKVEHIGLGLGAVAVSALLLRSATAALYPVRKRIDLTAYLVS